MGTEVQDNVSTMIGRASSPELDAILGKQFPVLDQGFVRVIDYMGNDAAIVQMARTSYGEGTETPSSDRGLIRYLMRHWHTSPFEGCELKLHVKLPIFVARQWIRHRTASLNEYSGRYSVMRDEFFLPKLDRLGKQSTTNKQGTGEGYSDDHATSVQADMSETMGFAFDIYNELIAEDTDLSRELARIVLPLSTYTEMYWKIDLHNLFHFLRLRADGHAQKEIRDYAAVIEDIVTRWVPHAFEAYVDYRRDAVTFSRMEIAALRQWISDTWPDDPEYGGFGPVDCLTGDLSKRELAEFVQKLQRTVKHG